jgi:hypothetical protein
MMSPIHIRQRAQQILEQLPSQSLPKAIEFLEILAQESSQPLEMNSQTRETDLLAVIQRRLPPNEQVRLNNLRQRSETGTLSELEHQELLKYVERIELQDAERAAALIELAQFRQVPLERVLDEFLPADRVA